MFSRKKKFFVLSIALLFVSCLIFTGCGNSNTQQTPPANNNQTDTQNNKDTNNTNNTDNVTNNTDNNVAENTKDNSDLSARAEKIADAVVNDVAQVKDARTVISEKIAYVSVAIEKTADTAESAALKDEITQVVKKTDTEIETVYVMEDPNTFTRMKEIGEDIANGKPISGFVEELENLFVRVTPSAQ